MSESSPTGRLATSGPAPLRRTDADASSAEHAGALDREWARRRQETFVALESAIQQAMGTVLQTTSQVLEAATDVHREMEREAHIVLQRLEDDRRRLAEEIAGASRTRDRVMSEIGAITRRTEEEAGRIRDAAHAESMRITRGAHEDAGRIRRTASEESERMLREARDEASGLRQQAGQEHASVLRDAEERREQLLAEIRQMEQQFATVADRMGSILGRPLSAPAAAAPPAAASRLATAETSHWSGERGGPERRWSEPAAPPEPPTWLRREPGNEPARAVDRRREPAAEVRPAEHGQSAEPGVGPRATVREASTPGPRRTWAPSVSYRSDPLPNVEHEPVRAWAAPSRAPAPASAPDELARARPPEPIAATPRSEPVDGADPRPRGEPTPIRERAVAAGPVPDLSASAPASEPAALASVATLPTPPGGGEGRTAMRIAIANTPNLGRALEVQRSIQRTPGVRDVRALQFEHGVLLLNVEHDDGLDLAGAVGSLPSVSLETVGQGEDLLEFRFPAA